MIIYGTKPIASLSASTWCCVIVITPTGIRPTLPNLHIEGFGSEIVPSLE